MRTVPEDPDDRVILITGASSGIGAATARAASEAGYRVVLGARRKRELDKLARELGGADRALSRGCDVTNWSDVEGLVEAALSRFGQVDAVFANAGFGAKRGFLEESVEHWKAMIDTNILGVALTIRATLPHLLDRGSGHYLLTGSIAGRRIIPGSLYSATKWAVSAMGESLRQELRGTHSSESIRVTVIAPGMVDTEFFDEPPSKALGAGDIAAAAMYALSQPPHVDVNEIVVRPASQAG